MLRYLSLLAVVTCAAAPADYFQAIRSGSPDRLISCIGAGGVNDSDARQSTPLHYAAAFGNTEAVRLLLDAGAKVNVADNTGATPLFLGATSAAKVRLLIKAGADPNIATKAGRTPLMIAAARADGLEAVRALLDGKAVIDTADMQGQTAFLEASGNGSLDTVKLLLARGANARAADKASAGALLLGVSHNQLERVSLLLKAGADPNTANTFAGKVRHGDIGLTYLTPLMVAATHTSPAIVKTLLEAGAKVETKDGRGMTPLMAAVSSDRSSADIVKMLLAAGANAKADDGRDETVADWARKANDPAVVKSLAAAGALPHAVSNPPTRKGELQPVTEAVDQALTLLGKSAAEFFNQSGCIGCHHQPLTAFAYRAATRHGIKTSPAAFEEMRRGMTAGRPMEPLWMQFVDTGGDVDTVGYMLAGAAAAGVEANSLTDAGVRFIAGRQLADGSWPMFGISRPPVEESNIGRTAISVRAMKAYAWPAIQPEIDARVERARAWLLKASPRNTYERAELVLGLQATGAPTPAIRKAAAALLRDQRDDGGWSQTAYLSSDAYATGLALHALYEAGQIDRGSPAYQRGAEYLRRTQLDDGSWYVRSRAPKFQPYFQSGFPHDHDQWISATATAWAVMALAPAAQR